MTHFKKISHIFKGIVLWYFKTFFEVCDHEGHCFFSKAFLRFSDKLADLKRRIEDRAVNQKVTQSISFMEKKCAFFFQSKVAKGLVFYTKIEKSKNKSFYQLASLTGAQITTKVGDLESSFDKIEFCPTFDRSYNFSSTVVFSFNYSQPLKYFSF